jgi:hypothetical protein
MANNSWIAVWAQHCRTATATERFGNFNCFHVKVKSGSHRNNPGHALNTEPGSEIIYYHPRTEADLASETLCCVQNSRRLEELQQGLVKLAGPQVGK